MTSLSMELFEPNQYLGQPYKWLVNQCSHIVLGFVTILFICVSFHFLNGEYPVRVNVGAYSLVAYLLFEILVQGWRRWDTIEDTVFVVVYGGWGTLIASREISIGDTAVTVNPYALTLVAMAVSVHLFLGYMWRKNTAN